MTSLDLSLFTIFKQLLVLDKLLLKDNANLSAYRQRSQLLQQIGCYALAIQDHRVIALLEQQDDIDKYNSPYHINDYVNQFVQQFSLEKKTAYYDYFFGIVLNDKYFFESTLDPFHYILRAGNLRQLGLYHLALRDYKMGLEYLAKFPQEHAIACTDASPLLNLLGDHQYGWALYEKRWDTNYKTFKNPMVFPQPKWTGEFDHSIRLFVYSEQGIGDNIQFLRYVILLKQQGLDVLVLNNSHIDDYLAFNLRKYDIECVKLGQEITFTYWIPMMSLPHLLDCHLENIPYSSGYLSTSGDFLQKWQAKVPAVTKKKRIGVVWKGNSDNGKDSIRSIPLSIFSQLFSIDADFHCLQKEISEQDLAFLEKFSHVYTWHTELESFFDTSALLAQLDLIICIDSSVAHLSGAMGKPCWLLINHSPDFRWLLDRNDSIWYDSVRLFRQDADFNWGNVIRRVENKLRLFIQQDMK